jgi:hypothetical protein
MRRVLIGDLMAAAAVLPSAPQGQRAQLAQNILCQTDAAHRYFKRFGRPHPLWGDGSLLTRALASPRRIAPDLSDANFLHLLALMTLALAHHKSSRSRDFDLPDL